MIKQLTVNNRKYEFNYESGSFSVKIGNYEWKQDENFSPYIRVWTGELDRTVYLLPEPERKTRVIKKLYFSNAIQISHEIYDNGCCFGIRSRYSGWYLDGKLIPLYIETLIWVHKTTGKLYFELIPISEDIFIRSVSWPAPLKWDVKDNKSYIVCPNKQGMLIPSDWNKEVNMSEVFLGTADMYMPWFGYVSDGCSCLQIIDTQFDCGFNLQHQPNMATKLNIEWSPSLGKIGYKRVMHMEFSENADYNTLCKQYRQYIREKGKLITLLQKEIANPKVKELYGCPIIHTVISFKASCKMNCPRK